MKIWRVTFVMLAAFSLASCSSDDESNVYEAAELGGTWQKVYDEGIADAGIVQYTFHPQSANNGTVDIFTSDWAASDTTVYRISRRRGHQCRSHRLVRACRPEQRDSSQKAWRPRACLEPMRPDATSGHGGAVG